MIISEIFPFSKKIQRLPSDVLKDCCSEKLHKIYRKVPAKKYLSSKFASLKFAALPLIYHKFLKIIEKLKKTVNFYAVEARTIVFVQ